jgi:hypothetical protein
MNLAVPYFPSYESILPKNKATPLEVTCHGPQQYQPQPPGDIYIINVIISIGQLH